MSEALVTLATSLRHGRNSKHIQYDTMQKTRTWLNNAHDARQEYLCKTVVGLDRAKQYVTTGHTSGKWFGCFMRGSRMRMGMIHRQNEALTLALVMMICAGAKGRWHLPVGDSTREELEDLCCFHVGHFGGRSTRGGGTADITGWTPHFLGQVKIGHGQPRHAYFAGTLQGRGRRAGDAMHSGLLFRKWMEQVLHCRINLQGQETGWLFQDRQGARVKFGRYDALLRALVDQSRERHPRLIPEAVKTKDISLWRSPRRGVVLETTNQDVLEKVIKLINRWRKK
jgi:hypothetical protein